MWPLTGRRRPGPRRPRLPSAGPLPTARRCRDRGSRDGDDTSVTLLPHGHLSLYRSASTGLGHGEPRCRGLTVGAMQWLGRSHDQATGSDQDRSDNCRLTTFAIRQQSVLVTEQGGCAWRGLGRKSGLRSAARCQNMSVAADDAWAVTLICEGRRPPRATHRAPPPRRETVRRRACRAPEGNAAVTTRPLLAGGLLTHPYAPPPVQRRKGPPPFRARGGPAGHGNGTHPTTLFRAAARSPSAPAFALVHGRRMFERP